jgi:hypothetical protein
MHGTRTLIAAAALLAVAGCGDDDDTTASAPSVPATDDGPGGEVPECPGPGDTITAALTDGCLIDGEQMVVVQQGYDQADGTQCVIVIWDQEAEGGWGVLGESPGEGSWSANTDDPAFVNPCTS